MSADTGDKTRAVIAELAIKTATTEGISDLCDAVMTPDQYAPSSSATLGRDNNRGTAVGIMEAIRALPVRLPIYTRATLPTASDHTGALVFCSDANAGTGGLLFSDGGTWLKSTSWTPL